MQIIVLLIVAVCVIAIVRTNRRRKELEKAVAKMEAPPIVEKLESAPTPPPSPPMPTPEPTPPSANMKLIYSFHGRESRRVCRFCDGENNMHAETCRVCGQKLN